MRPAIGLCRFSFVGRGDWVGWRGQQDDPTLRARTAAHLYADARMARRFWTFEHLLLASLQAQDCPDWRLIVLTSAQMPAAFRDRLHALCATDPRLLLEVSTEADVNAALLPAIARMETLIGGRGRSVQFRIDDDDCLSRPFVGRLGQMATALSAFPAFSFSMPRGLIATFYDGAAPRAYRQQLPFHSAGTAVRLPPRRARTATIFSFGHFGLGRRWHAVSDHGAPGFFAVKMAGHDSAPIPTGGDQKHLPIPWQELEADLARDFPFVDLGALRSVATAH